MHTIERFAGGTLRISTLALVWLLPSCTRSHDDDVALSAEPLATDSAAATCAPPEPGATPIPFGGANMVAVCKDAYADPDTTDEERAALGRDYAAASARIVEVFGADAKEREPRAIFCKTDACKLYFAGPAKRSWTLSPGGRVPGATYVASDKHTVIIVSSGEVARGHLTHEMVHVEMGARLRGAFVPQWFHEGAAASLANAPDCSEPTPKGIDDLRTLDANGAWAEYTNQRTKQHPTYCQARAEVERWISKVGMTRFLALLDQVADGASFDDVYGPMMTQKSTRDRQVVLSRATVTLSGEADSSVVFAGVRELSDGKTPFSLAVWIKPERLDGVLAHLSAAPRGGGFCTPLLGYDRSHKIVGQVLRGHSDDLSSYAVATDTSQRTRGKWTHVAMTWAPGSANRLYVNGALVSETSAPTANASGGGSMFLTWGSDNMDGATCWHGAVTPGGFKGSLSGMSVYDVELDAARVKELAAIRPAGQ